MKRLAFRLAGEKLHAVQNCRDLDFCLKASRKKMGRDSFFHCRIKWRTAWISRTHLTVKHVLVLLTEITSFPAISNNSLMEENEVADLIVIK